MDASVLHGVGPEGQADGIRHGPPSDGHTNKSDGPWVVGKPGQRGQRAWWAGEAQA